MTGDESVRSLMSAAVCVEVCSSVVRLAYSACRLNQKLIGNREHFYCPVSIRAHDVVSVGGESRSKGGLSVAGQDGEWLASCAIPGPYAVIHTAGYGFIAVA
jgi:hypothetical protein